MHAFGVKQWSHHVLGCCTAHANPTACGETALDAFLQKLRYAMRSVFHHLDTALTVLSDGTALACREAFTARGWRQLHAVLDRIVPLPRSEAMRFTLNLVEVGERVILGAASPVVEACL
jgi:N-dimethylarginine dimethylaminohydrolase